MVSMLADWSSLAGLLVGVAGFAFSIWLLFKAKNAADKTRSEIRRTLDVLSTHLLSDEIAKAEALVSDLRMMCQNQRWELAADRCATLRMCLIHIMENNRLAPSVLTEQNFSMDDVRLLLDNDGRPVTERMWNVVYHLTGWIHVLGTRVANDALEIRTYERESG